MAFWAKLLVVVVFILSLVFASMSVVLFGKREDYRATLKKTQDDYAVEKDTLTRANAKLTAERDEKGREAGEAKANFDAAQLRLDAAIHEGERKAVEYAAKDNENQKVKDIAIEQAASLGKLGDELKNALAESQRAETESHTLQAKLIDEESRANKLDKESTELTASLKASTDALGKAEETLKLNDDIFAELSRRNVAWRELIAGWATLPDIKGKVVKVDAESNFILLNVGQKQGVMKNYGFSIFRDGVFVAKVSVIDVQDDLCAARVVVPKLPIQRGDNAWTRLSD